eukprot:COSAG06_NODE_36801_length_442_cov_2.516035_1_plen_102_part_01
MKQWEEVQGSRDHARSGAGGTGARQIEVTVRQGGISASQEAEVQEVVTFVRNLNDRGDERVASQLRDIRRAIYKAASREDMLLAWRSVRNSGMSDLDKFDEL